MGLRPVAGLGREAALAMAPRMRGHAFAGVQDLNGRARDPHVHLLAHQRVGHAVVVPQDINVVVNVHARLLPAREFVALLRQRQKRWPIQRLEERAPAPLQLLEGAIVQLIEERADLLVQLGQAEEGPFTKASQDPALHEEHPGLHFGLVTGLPHSGREHGRAVVHGHLVVSIASQGGRIPPE